MIRTSRGGEAGKGSEATEACSLIAFPIGKNMTPFMCLGSVSSFHSFSLPSLFALSWSYWSSDGNVDTVQIRLEITFYRTVLVLSPTVVVCHVLLSLAWYEITCVGVGVSTHADCIGVGRSTRATCATCRDDAKATKKKGRPWTHINQAMLSFSVLVETDYVQGFPAADADKETKRWMWDIQ